MIQMPTQTEVVTWAEQGIAYRRPDSDEPGNRFRLYEVAGMPHNNSREARASGTIRARSRSPISRPARLPRSALNHLIDWIATGKAPPHAPPIAVDQNTRATAHIWRWTNSGTLRVVCATSGWMCPWRPMACSAWGRPGAGSPVPARRHRGAASRHASQALSKQGRLFARVEQRLKELTSEGWFLPEYDAMVRADVKAFSLP